MKKWMAAVMLAGVALAAAACGGGGSDLEELNVAYFEGWPLPPQIGQADGSFAEAVGVDSINWIPLADGGAMNDGMSSGSVDIAYSQGLTPFANGINSGLDLKLVGIAVSYADADNCVISPDIGAVDESNAAEKLNGATVMTPFGNVTHYKMLATMDFLGVDLSTLNIVQHTDGATTAGQFEQGQIDVGCAFGGPLVTMLDAGGAVLMSGDDQLAKVGLATYDIVSIPTSFGEEHGEVVTSFLAAMEDFNEQWLADPETNNPIIAQAAGMEDVGNFLGGPIWFTFPSTAEQLSSDWMGGNVGAAMQGQIETLAELGGGDPANGDFLGAVDTSYLKAIDG